MPETAAIDRLALDDTGATIDPALGYAAFDADNHYYEAEDALTRHLPKEWRVRGAKWADINGRKRLLLGDKLFNFIPDPTFSRLGKPGALHDYFACKLDGADMKQVMGELEPCRPEYRDRAARLKVMDQQGLAATWLFPTLAVGIEVAFQPDIPACLASLSAFNRWLLDDWGFNQQGRIFAAPVISFSDPAWAVQELEWCIANGAKVVTMRNGPVYTPTGMTSPGAPAFDPVWARIQEANLVLAPHAGDDGYDFLGKVWEPWDDYRGFHVTPMRKVVTSQRAVPDFFGALICHKVFERFPRLRVASVENGAGWIKPLKTRLYRGHAQTSGYYTKNPLDQFDEHIWVTPFWEDDLDELATHIPAERIMFGSDWPHLEGTERPLDFLASLASFSPADKRMVMRDNVAGLTATANP